MDAQSIVSQVVEAIKAAPERAQELVSDPSGAIESITGATGFDVTEVLQCVIARAGELGLDLSGLDLSQLDLSQIELSRLDIASLARAAGGAGLDVGALASKVLGSGGLGGLLGGIFGR